MTLQKAEAARRRPDQGEAMPDDCGNAHFIALLGHELRGPLSTIRNALNVWRRCGDDEVERTWAHGVLDRQTHKLDCLIQEMMHFSRICCGHAVLEKRPVDLAEVVSLAIESVWHRIDEGGQILQVALPPVPVTLLAAPTQLEQVLTNLLDNAAKYTSRGGRIGLTAALEEDDVVISVQDDGIGIAKEALAHVFDMFWQSSPGRSRGGLGVGLALVRQLVELHGGLVSVKSDGPGHGSEFVVRLPRTAVAREHFGTPFAEKGIEK